MQVSQVFVAGTMGGAACVLAGAVALAASHTGSSLDLAELARRPPPPEMQRVLFPLLVAGFGTLLPIVPLHQAFLHAEEDASSSVSFVLVGIVGLLGGYGLLRLAVPLLPEGARTWAPVLAVVGALQACHGGLLAAARAELVPFIAHVRVHAGGVVLFGIATLEPEGRGGAALCLAAWSLLGALFYAIVSMLRARSRATGQRDLAAVARATPRLRTLLAIGVLAAFGMPGFAVFSGEVAVWFAAALGDAPQPLAVRWPALAAMLLVAGMAPALVLRGLGRTLWTAGGDPRAAATQARLGVVEWALVWLLLVPLFVGGLFPASILALMGDPLAARVGALVFPLAP